MPTSESMQVDTSSPPKIAIVWEMFLKMRKAAGPDGLLPPSSKDGVEVVTSEVTSH